jgi:hypothetical protein
MEVVEAKDLNVHRLCRELRGLLRKDGRGRRAQDQGKN